MKKSAKRVGRNSAGRQRSLPAGVGGISNDSDRLRAIGSGRRRLGQSPFRVERRRLGASPFVLGRNYLNSSK